MSEQSRPSAANTTGTENSKLHGIVLAGGAAQRLPNKVLLPVHLGSHIGPCILSSLNYLVRHDVKMISVVIGPDSPVPDVVEGFDPMLCDSIDWVVQPEPTGVCDAIHLVAQKRHPCVAATRSMILCGDNVYPHGENLQDEINANDEFVVCRHLEAWRSTHLVRMSYNAPDQRHTSEDTAYAVFGRQLPGRVCLTTPWVLSHRTMGDAWMRGDDMARVLNELNACTNTRKRIEGVLCRGDGWHDIGTPATYAHYWRSE